MSTYIEILNRIKKNYSKDWFTSSQNDVYTQLLNFLEPPYYIINIYGSKGVGKTFMGWVLQSEDLGQYITSPDYLNSFKLKNIILDNSSSDRTFIRNLRNILKLLSLDRIIILTKNRAEDNIPAFNLKVSYEDVKTFKDNLSRIDITTKDIESLNLWDYINCAEV